MVDRIEPTLDRTDQVLTDAEGAVREVAVISAAATTAIETATEVAAAAAVVVGEAERSSRSGGTVVAEADAVAARRRHRGHRGGGRGHRGRAAGRVRAGAAPGRADGQPLRRAAQPRGDERRDPPDRRAAEAQGTPDGGHPADPGHAGPGRPDLHDLLDVTRDLKLAVAGIPGLGMLRRRGEKLTDDAVA